jgi:hypothetical protein
MSTSVWPADYLKEPHEIHREHGNHLVVFLISPFKPRERYDELLAFCQSVCAETGQMMGAQVECIRADSLSMPNVIHQDIWNYIQMSDAIIADVSDQNGNVMLELGVAASFRDKNNVIVIRDDESEGGFLFDISPARHLTYRRSLSGSLAFRDKLRRALLFSLTPAPYVPRDMPAVEPPLNLQLTEPTDCARLLSPSNSHRRLLSDGLEFYVFRYSWLTLGLEQFASVRVQAEMRFAELRPSAAVGQGWIGIMLRSQHFFANWGHLIYVVSDGTVRRTQPIDEFNKEDEEPSLGQIQGFSLTDWVNFDLRFDEYALSGSVGGVVFNIPVTDMPYRYNAGLIRFQTHIARAWIRTLQVEIPA